VEGVVGMAFIILQGDALLAAELGAGEEEGEEA
jgi:hypothetical protein